MWIYWDNLKDSWRHLPAWVLYVASAIGSAAILWIWHRAAVPALVMGCVIAAVLEGERRYLARPRSRWGRKFAVGLSYALIMYALGVHQVWATHGVWTAFWGPELVLKLVVMTVVFGLLVG